MRRDPFGYYRAEKERKAKEKAEKKTRRYGVFIWHENPRYPESEAVKVFKRESAAKKFADAGFVLNYVVRPL